MKSTQLSTWQANLTAAARRDPKKATVLAVLIVILLVAVGRMAIGGKASPARASASPPGPKQQMANTKTLRVAARRDSSAAMGQWLSSPAPKVQRNIFAMKLEYYTQVSIRKSKTARLLGDKNLNEEEKSLQQQADDKKERQTLTESLQFEARQLKLTSTMMNATPTAIINGQMVREGDVVASGPGETPQGAPATGFRVLKVEPRRVIIEREGIKLEILMK